MRLRRAILKDKPVVVGDIATHLVLDFVKEYGEVEVEFERSERLQALEDWGQKWKRTSKRLAAPLPMSVPIKLAVAVIPELAIAYSRGVGSYDLRTPEVQRYEESVHFGGSGGMII
jgi:hypothetical protein